MTGCSVANNDNENILKRRSTLQFKECQNRQEISTEMSHK